MCGLMGTITHHKNGFDGTQMDAAATLLWLTQLRGRDSTGVVTIDNTKSSFWVKDVGSPEKLFKTKLWTEHRANTIQDGSVLFGHCRAATKGTISINNAHPFTITRKDKSEVVLVHNGTLHDYQSLEGKDKFQVDSHWLAHLIATKGVTETLGKVNGPIAMMWWDSRDKTFNVFRNGERPLYQAKDNFGTVWINSEKHNLEWLSNQFNIHFNGGITYYDPWVHYSMPIGPHTEWTKTKIERIFTQAGRYSGQPYGVGYLATQTDRYGWDEYAADESAYENWKRSRNPSSVAPLPQNSGVTLATSIANQTRTLVEDGKRILSGEYVKVEWSDHDMMSTYAGGITTVKYLRPYLPNLKKMILHSDPTKLRFEFLDPATKETSFKIMKLKKDVPVESKDLPPSQNGFSISGLKFKKGRKLTFKHKLKGANGKVVSHVAVCDFNNPQTFTFYSNNVDREVKQGDKVIVEVTDAVPIVTGPMTGSHTCYGYELKEKQDLCIEYKFLNINQTHDRIKEFPYFEGEVSHVHLTTKNHFKENGSVVLVHLINVKPLETLPDSLSGEVTNATPETTH